MSESNRIQYPPPRVWSSLFDAVQRDALELAERGVGGTLISAALSSLSDCEYGPGGDQGATYRSASYAARLYGMDDRERQEWLKLVEQLGLTQRHIGHVLARAPFHEPTASERQSLGVGDRVRHHVFGEGEVVGIDPEFVRVVFLGEEKQRIFLRSLGYVRKEPA